MYLKLTNIKAIERQKDSYLLVIENRHSKLGEDLYWINYDAFNIITNLDGTKTMNNLIGLMAQGDAQLFDEAKENLQLFLKSLKKLYGVKIEILEEPVKTEIPVLGTGRTQYPSAISLEITHKCNAKCLHCYGDYSPSNVFSDNTESIKKVLRDARKSGTRVVEFTGGEVTCHPRFIELLKEAYALGYNLVSILSNGLYWSEELFEVIKQNRARTAIQIDLHGDNDEYINWFMGTEIRGISERIKRTIVRIHEIRIPIRVVTMVTPGNLEQLVHIADWVHEVGIDSYGLSSITPMGRADKEDRNNLLLKTEEDLIRCSKVIEEINKKYGQGFLYEVKDGDSRLKNCGAFTSNPSITPEGNIKFCAMDDETNIKSFGNVFQENIGDLYTNKFEELNLIRNIPAPHFESEECRECEEKFFCSYCIIRGLAAAKSKNYNNCPWYLNKVPNKFKELLI